MGYSNEVVDECFKLYYEWELKVFESVEELFLVEEILYFVEDYFLNIYIDFIKDSVIEIKNLGEFIEVIVLNID